LLCDLRLLGDVTGRTVLVTGGDDDQPIVWNVDRGVGVRRLRGAAAAGEPVCSVSASSSPG